MNNQLAAAGVDIVHHFAGGIYSKETRITAGLKLTQHVHPYDHASALVRGTVLLEVEGETRQVTGPAILMIEAGKAHSVTSVTDVVWHCIHICDDTDPDTVDATILGGPGQ